MEARQVGMYLQPQAGARSCRGEKRVVHCSTIRVVVTSRVMVRPPRRARWDWGNPRLAQAGDRRRCRYPMALHLQLGPGATSLRPSALDMHHTGPPLVGCLPQEYFQHQLQGRVWKTSRRCLRFPCKKDPGVSWGAYAKLAL